MSRRFLRRVDLFRRVWRRGRQVADEDPSCCISVIEIIGQRGGQSGMLLLRGRRSLSRIIGTESFVFSQQVTLSCPCCPLFHLSRLHFLNDSDGRPSVAVSRVLVFPTTDTLSTRLRRLRRIQYRSTELCSKRMEYHDNQGRAE
jgi:hypothetical protein